MKEQIARNLARVRERIATAAKRATRRRRLPVDVISAPRTSKDRGRLTALLLPGQRRSPGKLRRTGHRGENDLEFNCFGAR